MYNDVYISLNVPFSKDLVRLQDEICLKLQLHKRKEFHLTFAYLGQLSKEEVSLLKEHLLLYPRKDLLMGDLAVKGLGLAIEKDNSQILIDKYSNSILEYPRVLWVSIDITDAMLEYRDYLMDVLKKLNLNTSYMGSSFYPHLTLGSNGPSGKDFDWTLWDVHSVKKENSFKYEDVHIPDLVTPSKLHITDVSIHPKSLALISSK